MTVDTRTSTRTGAAAGGSRAIDWEWARGHVEAPLRSAIARLDPATHHVCGYHLGYWDVDGLPASGGGKGLRAFLALLSAQAAGVGPGVGVPAGVACELVHNFSLLHDDVMDGDRQRRHCETAWSCFGISPAILAGDGMLTLANEVLAETASPTSGWAIRVLSATTRTLIAGQAADLDFETREDVTLSECLDMAGDKTGALIAGASCLGAVLADAPAWRVDDLAEFGQHLGLAFQGVDDLLGIWGASARTGKPVGSDLRSRKKTLPVMAALETAGPEAEELRDLYFSPRDWTDESLARAVALVEAAGGREWVRDRIGAESRAAHAVIDRMELPEHVRGAFSTLIDDMSERSA